MKKNFLSKLKIYASVFAAVCLTASFPMSAMSNIVSDYSYYSGASATSAAQSLAEATYSPGPEYVRYLGRTKYLGKQMFMANSGSGGEFSFYGNKCSITFQGDTTSTEGPENRQARIAIYVNGVRTIDTIIDSEEKTVDVVTDVVPNAYTIQIVKLSEATFSVAAVKSITVNATDVIKPTAEKSLLIEFIGDSITCGYGVDDADLTHTFSTRTEDATKSYAYLTAEKLGADSSLFAISGYGILAGVSAVYQNEYRAPKSVSQYYNDLGFSQTHIAHHYAQTEDWNFYRPADVVVVNLGTNDYQYIEAGEDTTEDFIERYIEFLSEIREVNPNAAIICTLGMMGDELYPAIETAVQTVISGPGNNSRIYTLKLNKMDPATEGQVVNEHPSAVTHEKASELLTAKIKEVMGL